MAKIVTKKSDIPKYAKEDIKNFKNLTTNQAIFEYELLKLKRRAGKELASYLVEQIKKGERITKKLIETVSGIKGKRLQSERVKYESEKRLISIDLNEEIRKEKQYRSPQQYLKETGQVIDPATAEVVSIADAKQLAREFFDRVIADIENKAAQAQVTYSSYKSGRTRSALSRQWVSDNIARGTRKLIDLINSRRVNEETELAFYRSLEGSKLAQLQDAISEYMAGLYYQTAETINGYMQESRVYKIISNVPVSMADARSFDNSGDNSEEEENDEE